MSGGGSGPSQTISLPKGGGALHGIGEKFAPDLHTGTGNFTVPISLPPGRNGFQPQLNLVYSTGNGNGPFGFGWNLSVPGVTRKTSKGIPRYRDDSTKSEDWDTFILSGAEDLVPVPGAPSGAARYRPRTEGLFARIERVHSRTDKDNDDYWKVRSKDGLISFYGTPGQAGNDPAVIADPADKIKRTKVFAWKLTLTEDPFGNRIEYAYRRDSAEEGPRHWDQLYLETIRYVDYTNDQGGTDFLVSVSFIYDEEAATQRPDAFSEYRAGFEIRTRRRCKWIVVATHTDRERLVRAYELLYLDERSDLANRDEILPLNAASLLSRIHIVGYDDAGAPARELPPLEFGYTRFEPAKRKFFPVAGQQMPPLSLANPSYELVDLFGNGLPDVLEMNGSVRYWRNLGNGKFDLPRPMATAPAGVSLGDPGVQLLDANGDGRADLLVTTEASSGYYPLSFNGAWDRKSFQRYAQAPSFNLRDPEVRLLDLDGDGVTDVIRSGSRLECFFNDPHRGWLPKNARWVERKRLEDFPNVNFSDPRVKWADISGDGLQDIVLVYDGNVEYWPNLGYGSWGKRIRMESSPRFPYGYDPARILVADVDGDGLADIVYVDDRKVTLWINQSGNGWSPPIEIQGTPPVSDLDAVRVADLLGGGVAGVLWTKDAALERRDHYFFLDFTGGTKPYLLAEMNNHMGAVTKVQYAPSTRYYLEDQKHPNTRWRTPLPFPVQVVAQVEVVDELSTGKLTTEYRYRHGYWDGAEREFRGFGMVEQLDTESFENYNGPGLHGESKFFAAIDRKFFSPPTQTRTWFHQGPVGEEFGDWQELDLSYEFWEGDRPVLGHVSTINDFLKGLGDRRAKRDALRALRGSILRTELYALDGSDLEERPYTVTEHGYGLREESAPGGGEPGRAHIFFPHPLAQRTTQWERGDDPLSQFSFTGEYDEYGQPRLQIGIAVPRGRNFLEPIPAGAPAPEIYLATHTRTDFVQRDEPDIYIVDRVARTTTYEIINDGRDDLFSLKKKIESNALDDPLKIIGQSINFYDGLEFVGRPYDKLGDYGALVRTENLVLTDEILQAAYGADQPPYLEKSGSPAWTPDYPPEFQNLLPALAGYTYRSATADPEYTTGYFAATERRRCDFHASADGKGRGLVLAKRDPLGHDTTIEYEAPYDFLPSKVTDAAGLTTTAEYDHRVLQPSLVTDPNGNRTRFVFTAQGLLGETWVQGKEANNEGDRTRPSVKLEYGFTAFVDSREPVFVRSVRQVYHDTQTDIPLPQRDETIETREYSDGFGRLLQTRAQGEELRFGHPLFGGGEAVLPASQSDGPGTDLAGTENTDAAKPNVVVSGWQTYDNKGRVVEKYEPFFSAGWDYVPKADAQLGKKATLFYDPRGQVIRTLNPDGSEQRVVHGVPGKIASPDLSDPSLFEPTPWEAYTYDANDNAGRTHPAQSAAYKLHWNTPGSAAVDALGRTLDAVERLGQDAKTQWFHTRSTYDIRGNVLSVADALGREAFRYVYDLANRPLRVTQLDAGVRRTVRDAAGNTLEQRDSKGALVLHGYDALNRPVRLWARDGAGQPMTLRERLVYDGGRAINALGRLYRHYDEAGLLGFESYDFKGNVLAKLRQVIKNDEILSVFKSAPGNAWKVQAYRVDWNVPPGQTLDARAAALLDPALYRTTLSYDALNRLTRMIYPQDADGAGKEKELRPTFNRAGALERVELSGTTYVERIAYNAKGQRILVAYGNGIMTRYAHDPFTFRLARLRTDRYQIPSGSGVTYHLKKPADPLQDLAYDYDLAGNILGICDRTPGCGVLNNPDAVQVNDAALKRLLAAGDALLRFFEYDALYRLHAATGRECADIPRPRPWPDDPRCGWNSGKHGTANQHNAPAMTVKYQETYEYDPADNMVFSAHATSAGAWTRLFGMGGLTPDEWAQAWPPHLDAGEWKSPPGNRLTHAADDQPGTPQTHFFDANGNLTGETTSRHFEWDHGDRMRVFRDQTTNAAPTVHAHYLYDAAGQRVKKLTWKSNGTQIETTVYIDGLFEQHELKSGPTSAKKNNTLHVMDNQQRIGTVRVGKAFTKDVAPAVRYQLGDHLGSCSIVVDAKGTWINREEYFPYGETSFGSFAKKRYRFTGKERDEESGLYYHGARYYAPWVARWVSCDPIGPRDSLNLYVYASDNPARVTDPSGTQGSDQTITYSNVENTVQACLLSEHVTDASPPGPVVQSTADASLPTVDDLIREGKRPDVGSALQSATTIGPDAIANIERYNAQEQLLDARRANFLGPIPAIAAMIAGGDAKTVLEAYDSVAPISGLLTGLGFTAEARTYFKSVSQSNPDPLGNSVSSGEPVTRREGEFLRVEPSEESVLNALAEERFFGGDAPVDTRDFPRGGPVTALGYPRDFREFWQAYDSLNPGALSPHNLELIAAGRAPEVDAQWLASHPGQALYEGDVLIHHHIDQGPYAVAMPKHFHELLKVLLHPFL